jgi:hypothetical protein
MFKNVQFGNAVNGSSEDKLETYPTQRVGGGYNDGR